MRSTERFTGLATIYGQARPTYPQELVRWCLEQAPAPGLIVDLGCGTGISTRLFASTGHPVIGIDPNADMLATTLAANPLASAQTAPPTSSATTASASTPRGRSLCASSSDDDQLGACFAARTPHGRKSFCTVITAPRSSVTRMP